MHQCSFHGVCCIPISIYEKSTTFFQTLFLPALLVLVLHTPPVPAPFPPCSPLFFLNKVIESNNWSSDLQGYYPVKPCPYRDPKRAPSRLRFIWANPPSLWWDHIFREGLWFIFVGIPRAAKMLLGKEKFRCVFPGDGMGWSLDA